MAIPGTSLMVTELGRFQVLMRYVCVESIICTRSRSSGLGLSGEFSVHLSDIEAGSLPRISTQVISLL